MGKQKSKKTIKTGEIKKSLEREDAKEPSVPWHLL